MEVILTQDVAKLGKKHSVVTVPDGRGLNHLIPKGLALLATTENLKRVKARQQHEESDRLEQEKSFAMAVEGLKDKQPVLISVPANEQGHMFESLKVATILSKLEEFGVTLEEDNVNITSDNIKTLGEHTIELINNEQKVPLVINLVSE